jgi:cytoskeleton protein RodZ
MSIIESANGIGARLAEARSDQGLSVEDVSSRTYIRPGVIRGIEKDDFSPCGGPFYARGHIRTLARTLGIDEAPLIEQFDRSNGSAQPGVAPEPVASESMSGRVPRAARPPRNGPNWMAVATVVLIAVCLVALASLLLGGPSKTNGANTGPSVAPGAPSAPAKAPPQAKPAPRVYSGVNLAVRLANGSSWVQITDENGRVLASSTGVQGMSAQFQGAQQLRYTFGNAAAVVVSCNGKSLGSLGGQGQVVSRVLAVGDPACGPSTG